MINKNEQKIHIAIVDKPTIKKIATGIKSIESRFSKNRIKPFNCVCENDLVLLKNSGGAIHGYFFVEKAQFFENFILEDIKSKYNEKIAADDTFWNRKQQAKYASLLYCKKAVMTECGVFFHRKGMDGWLEVPKSDKPQIVCITGQIASGKTEYAKCIAQKLDAEYISFGETIQKYALENGLSNQRNDLQTVGQILIETHGGKFVFDLALQDRKLEQSNKCIVFDGIRHRSVYDEIRKKYENVKLIYIDTNTQERYRRYREKYSSNLRYKDFLKICNMPVEQEITNLKATADYIVTNVNVEKKNEAIEIIAYILFALLTGTVYYEKDNYER